MPEQISQSAENGPSKTDVFLFERAQTEHEVAERKRDATVTKATAVATLSAALIAIVAAPAFDASGLSSGIGRWVLLAAIFAFLASIALAGMALSVTAERGDRPSRRELDNWTTRGFRLASVNNHARDFAQMYVTATNHVRDATERAQSFLTLCVWCVGAGLLLLLATFFAEIV